MSISIRSARTEDAEELLKIYEPYVKTTAITFEYEVPSVEEFRGRIERTLTKYPYVVVQNDRNELLGYAYAGQFHYREAYARSVETSVYVKRDVRGQGIGRKLYEALESELANRGILNANACIAYPVGKDPYLDTSSVGFHEASGYRMVGRFHQCGCKFGRWYDVVWMEKMLGEHAPTQQ